MKSQLRLSQADIKKPSVTVPFTMQGLSRLVIWGTFAATAMLIALLASRGAVGSQRSSAAIAAINGSAAIATINNGIKPSQSSEAARPAFDMQAETKRLADTIIDLAASDRQIKERLDAVEQSITDVTGSIAKQINQTKNSTTLASWPDGPPVPSTSSEIAELVAPALPSPIEYGVDIGSAPSLQGLRARWAGVLSAHHDLLRGLVPMVKLREPQRTNNLELRLVIGPLRTVDAAAHLCTSLAVYRLYCEPTIFGGQHLALE